MPEETTEHISAKEYRAELASRRESARLGAEAAQTVALDPGVHTGLVSAREGKIEHTMTTTFWGAIRWILEHTDPADTLVLIEDARDNKPTFDHGVENQRKREKVSQNVGGVKKEVHLLIEGLQREGYDARGVTPRTAKWSRKEAKLYAGYPLTRTPNNQNVRDAIKILFQHNAI